MNLPFTADQFIQVFIAYNTAVWPMQIILNFMALAAIAVVLLRVKCAAKISFAILCVLWLWTGLVYHLGFFSPINPAAKVFAVLCLIQALIFGLLAKNAHITFQAGWDLRTWIGGLLITYGLFVYPLLGWFLGHRFPASPTFGAPCPATIFTFGLLLWARNLPRWSVIIPALWSVIGFTAALTMGIQEDYGLLIAGLLAVPMILFAKRTE